MSKTVAVIDGNSLMHRAFHAVPPTMTAPDGTPTNAIFGFFNMLLKFIDEAVPDAIVCAFDCGKPAFRIEALAQYKAQRPPMDDNLRVQFPLVEQLLSAMNIPVVKVEGWEGDDILGTVAARNEALGNRTLLLTGDKDACQLASELTHIVSMKTGVSDIAILGPAEVEAKYGVGPAQIPDYLGLMGDTADNIPGVPGIGDKTARKLLQAYGSIEGLYQNLDKLKGKQLENVRDNKEAAFLSRQVATIVRDADFELDLEHVRFPDYDADAVSAAFGKIRMASVLRKVLALLDDGTQSSAAEIDIHTEELLTGNDAQALLEQAIEKGTLIGVAAAQTQAASLFDENHLLLACSVDARVALFEDAQAQAMLARVIEKLPFACVDAKQILHIAVPANNAELCSISQEVLFACKPMDIALAAYVIDSSIGGTKEFRKSPFAVILNEYAGRSLPEFEQVQDALAFEACACEALSSVLTRKLEESGNTQAFAQIDTPLIAVLTQMERNGAAIDVEKLASLGASTQASLQELRAHIVEIAGEDFNVDSPKQLAHILFEVLGLHPIKKTKTGYSTDESVLTELAIEHPLPGLVLKYRELAKIKSTYIDALPPLRASDNLIHTSFNVTVTTTGRLSSSDPNLQNIPVRSDFGRSIRACFVPLHEGDVFVSADYSQIELRLLAHLSNDAGLIAAFNSGADFHAQTASQVFGVPFDQVTPEMRSRAKAVNFGIVYGQQAFGLAQSLGIGFKDAQEMINRYFDAYPGVARYLSQTVQDASEKGYAETMYGRKRHIPELRQSNKVQRGFGERTAMNHPMQGSAADIIKLAMVAMQKRLIDEGLKAKIMIQVHDELDLSVPAEELERVVALCKDTMEHVVRLSVPLDVDVSWGRSWAEAH